MEKILKLLIFFFIIQSCESTLTTTEMEDLFKTIKSYGGPSENWRNHAPIRSMLTLQFKARPDGIPEVNVMEPEQFQLLNRYFSDGKDLMGSPTTTHLLKIYSVERTMDEAGFQARLQSFANKERLLLWHGTWAKNMVSILETNLRYVERPIDQRFPMYNMLGRGVYFANAIDEATKYARANVQGINGGYVLVCEVALGKTEIIEKRQDVEYNSSAKYDSGKAVGTYFSQDNRKTEFKSGSNVFVPGRLWSPFDDKDGEDKKKQMVDYDHYVVRYEDQYIIRYLFEVQYRPRN